MIFLAKSVNKKEKKMGIINQTVISSPEKIYKATYSNTMARKMKGSLFL